MDTIISFFSLLFSAQNQYIVMFFSAFLSATVLPGNSEIIFSTLIYQAIFAQKEFISTTVFNLLIVATIGNSLGSMITYGMGFLVPKPIDTQNRYMKWALEKSEKYGVFVLLLSSLPIVGDILCAMAGWLRFNVWHSLFFITLGKLIRYLILLATMYPVMQYLL